MSEQNNNNDQNNQGQPQQQQPYQPNQPNEVGRAQSVPPAKPVQPYQGQPQQPIKPYQGQPQQPVQPYQGQPQQPVQPYQGQPQQPYQPYQGQPAQPYQPYQGQPQPYQPYQGGPPAPPKKKSKWWIWLIVIGVVVLAVGALFLFGVIDVGFGGVKRVGNEGAWEAYDYLDTMEQKLEKVMSPNMKELNERMEAEAFEIEGEIDLDSDLFVELLGTDHFGADFEIKYDMKDLGIKVDIIDLISTNIYLIEEDAVLELLGEAYQIPLDPETDVDLGEEMSLSARLEALSSVSAGGDFTDLFERVMAELAPAIPNEYTEKEVKDVYSPLEDEEVEMKATTTTLNGDELYEIIVAFGENLEQNEELLDDLQDFLDSVASTSGEDLDIDDIVEDMIDMDEDELDELDDFNLSWSVYEYKGDTVGLSFYIENAGDEIELYLITEFSNNAIYTSIIADFNGDEVVNFYSEVMHSGDDITTEATIEIYIPEDEYTDAMEFEITIDGLTTIEKDSSTEYEFDGEYTLEIDAGDAAIDLGLDGPMNIDLEVSGDCVFGDDLGTLEDDDDWNEIYDKDWGDIDDMMDGLFNFGGFGSFDGLGEFDGLSY